MNPPKNHKLAIFDIDGTIRDSNGVPQSVVDGLKHLQEIGFFTTISTGRGYVRAKELLGEVFESVVAPHALVIVEHGTKIVDREGNIIVADFFQENELEHIVDFLRANIGMVDQVRFWSTDPKQPIQVWIPSKEGLDEARDMLDRKGYHPEIFCCSYEELLERLIVASPSNISAKLKSYVVVENLKLHFTRSETDTIFQDGIMEFVRNIADKGKAIQYLEKHHDVAVSDMLIAGNAINDVDMLNLDAGIRILVGPDETIHTVLGYVKEPDTVVRVQSVEELGHYLQSLE